ncbi:MAG: PD-(D/E)XK nuclease family protein [Patescibacteria group bacterium]|nr:PD-(D/E)XK nuclease family protein [Patescibacteria group bacterium]
MRRIYPTSILVDNGFIEAMTQCPWKAYAAFELGRRSAEESAALRFGKHIHTALAYRNRMQFFKGVDVDVEEKQMQLLTNRFTTTPMENEGWRNLNTASLLIRVYNRSPEFNNPTHRYATHPKTGLPLVEQPFMVDTGVTIRGRRLLYIGRIDRVVFIGEHLYIRDYKTTSMLGDNTWAEAQMSEQLRGYCWVVKNFLGMTPMGYCYDVLAVRESAANAEWDPLLEVVRMPARSKAVPITLDTQKFFTNEPPGQLEEWFDNMCSQVETFLWHFDNNKFPRHHKHCRHQYGLCEYFKVCELPEHSRMDCLQSSMFKNNEWSPLYMKR